MSRNFELLTNLEQRIHKETAQELPFTLPSTSQRKATAGNNGAFAEEILRLVQRVFMPADESGPHQIVFYGVDGEDGSSSVCAEAARALAATSSKSVCLVDANAQAPRLSGALDVSHSSPVLRNRSVMRDGCVQIQDNLWLASTDTTSVDNRSLNVLDRLNERLTRLGRMFDFVLIDIPGATPVKDAAMMARLAGAAILVVSAHKTRRATARRAMETVEETSGITVSGTVLYDRKFPVPAWLYKWL